MITLGIVAAILVSVIFTECNSANPNGKEAFTTENLLLVLSKNTDYTQPVNTWIDQMHAIKASTVRITLHFGV
jgi:hypothetical protein